MNGRAHQILSRFPAHLEPTRPGKQLAFVVEALVLELDRLSADLAGVRRAHRLAHASTLRDVLLLAGLHGLVRADFELLLARIARARSLAAELDAAVAGGDAAARDAAAEALLTSYGVLGSSPLLALFAPPAMSGEAPDLDAAARELATRMRRLFDFTAHLDGVRRRTERLAKLHATGNGTVSALIEGCASALDLELDFEKNARIKAESRPRLTITTSVVSGTTLWAYVVVARPRIRSALRNSQATVITKGPAQLSDTDFNRIEWNLVPDARDYLVYRVQSGGKPAETGLLTTTPLPATATSFVDTGLAAAEALLPEVDDELFHSGDRYWHSSFARERCQISRIVEATLPANCIAMRGRIALGEFAAALGVSSEAVFARAAALEAAVSGLEAFLSPDTALRLSTRLGQPLSFTGDVSLRGLADELAKPPALLFTTLAAMSAPAASGRGVDVAFGVATAESIARPFGFLVFQPHRLLVGDSVRVSEVMRRTGASFDAVKNELVKIDIAGITRDTSLTFSEASQLLPLLGFEAVRPTSLRLDGQISVQSLAARATIPIATLLAELELLGVSAPNRATLLDGNLVAALVNRRSFQVEEIVGVDEDLIGIEENPLRRETTTATPRKHAELFPVYRRGFGRTLLAARIEGLESRSVAPMLVNRDEGHGIGYTGAVPPGKTLVFREDGRVHLVDVGAEVADIDDGEDVTDRAFAWRGACFAGGDDDPIHPRDFVFDGPGAPPERCAKFVVATPPGALDPDFTFPHPAVALPMPGIGLGKTRFAFFVQQAHTASTIPPALVKPAPRTKVGFADNSVFAAGAGETLPPAAIVALTWREHEAYAVRVLIPKRFAKLDGTDPATKLTVIERVRLALERVRPVGVDVRVEYQDDQWILGSAVIATANKDPILSLMGGTALWPPPVI